MFRQKALLLTVLIAASAVPVLGQGSPSAESQACFSQRVDQATDLPGRLAACSRVIGNSGASPEERAEAYLRRAFAYAQRAGQSNGKEDVDRALADLSAASRLMPNNQTVQKYVLETRASLQRLAGVSQPKGTEGTAPPASTPSEWIELGCQQFQPGSSGIRVSRIDKAYSTVRLLTRGADIEMLAMRLFFTSGMPETIDVNQVVKSGGFSRSLSLAAQAGAGSSIERTCSIGLSPPGRSLFVFMHNHDPVGFGKNCRATSPRVERVSLSRVPLVARLGRLRRRNKPGKE